MAVGNKEDINVIVSFDEKTNIMDRLSICKAIKEELANKGIRRGQIEAAGLWSVYKRVAKYIKTEGEEGSFKDDKIKDLAKVAGYQLDICTDYTLKEINS